MTAFFHDAQRQLQAQMGTSRIADRIESTRLRHAFNDTDAEIVSGAEFFFIASAAPDGRLDCSVKCGPAGFAQLLSDSTLAFPDYDGNGMFRTLGNIGATSQVALLFVEFWGDKRKLRIHGQASIARDDETLGRFAGAQLAVVVQVSDIFPNCPRYLPSLQRQKTSEFVDALGSHPLEPLWKSKPDLADFVHDRKAF